MSASMKKKRCHGTAPATQRHTTHAPRDASAALDDDARVRNRVLAKMKGFTLEEACAAFIRAGILGADGKLTAWYRNDEPSKHRPTD